VETHVQDRDQQVQGHRDAKAEAAAAQRRTRAAAEAAKLDGITVTKRFKDPATKKYRPYIGKLRYLGAEAHPQYLLCEWEDGQRDYISAATANKLQRVPAPELTAGVEQPATGGGQLGGGRRTGRRRNVATVATLAALQQLPSSWDLGQPDQLAAALQKLMPGKWHQGHITGLAKKMPGAAGFLQAQPDGSRRPECVPILESEVERLLECVNLAACATVVDPFSGTGTITRVLSKTGRRVYTNDIHPGHTAVSHRDALQPGFYTELRQQLGVVDAIVTSPWFAALDLALPLLVEAAASVACVHVPGHYLTSGVEPRYKYLRELQAQGRLHVIMGLPRGPMGRRCIWLLVFRSSAVRQRLLSPACRVEDGWTM
jgi:hypothetical protein